MRHLIYALYVTVGLVGLVGVVGWVVGPQDIHVSPWNFENGASSKIDDILVEDGGLLHVLPLAVQLQFFFGWTSWVDHSGPFLLSELFCETPPSCLKVMGWWWWWWWPTGF